MVDLRNIKECGLDLLTRLGARPSRELNIYLVRHIFTEANRDEKVLLERPDRAIRVIPEARAEAEIAAQFMANKLWDEYQTNPKAFGRILVLYSPFDRTQDSTIPYLYYLGQKFGRDSDRILYRPDDRLIELQIGLRGGRRHEEMAKLFPHEFAYYELHKHQNAGAYAPSPLGESYMELAWRVRGTHPAILNDYERKDVRHCLVVSHGGTSRAFAQGWMNYNPQWMLAETNPGNNWIRHLQGVPRNGLVVDPENFRDLGYVHGKGAPLHNPAATQTLLKGAEDSFVLLAQRPNDAVPPGMKIIDPFQGPRRS